MSRISPFETTSLGSLTRLNPGVRTKRVSSYDRTGGNGDCLRIEPGATQVLADIPGAGCIRHIWFTISCADPMYRRNLVMRMYWDGEANPSVESPVGDFFGQGWGEEYSFISLPLAAAPTHGKALNSYFHMPFGHGARVEIENQSEQRVNAFYYYIDYEEYAGDNPAELRFHASWRRELTQPAIAAGEAEWGLIEPQGKNTTNKNNYVFADISGAGQFIGINYFVHNPGPMWYGEGDDMWMVDGEAWPGSLHGTGTEDFFNSSWCPNEIYMHPYFGYARIPGTMNWMGKTHCYRFFIEDPVYFTKSLHASIEHGHNNTLTLDLVTVAYWYQTEPHKIYPALPGPAGRQNMPETDMNDVHMWRHAWREKMGGGGQLWGNEWRKDR